MEEKKKKKKKSVVMVGGWKSVSVRIRNIMRPPTRSERPATGRWVPDLIADRSKQVASDTLYILAEQLKDNTQVKPSHKFPLRGHAMKQEHKEIPIKKLIPSPYQARIGWDEIGSNGYGDKLAASIEEIGLMVPIIVRIVANGQFEVIAGHCRWKACEILNWEKIPAIVYYDMPDDEALKLHVYENEERKDRSSFELALTFKKAKDKGYSLRQLEKIFKDTEFERSKSTIANMLKIFKLPEQIQNAVRDEKMDLSCAGVLVDIMVASAWWPAEQDLIFRKAKRFKLGLTDVKDMVDLVKKESHRKLPENLRRKLWNDEWFTVKHANLYLFPKDNVGKELSSYAENLTKSQTDRLWGYILKNQLDYKRALKYLTDYLDRFKQTDGKGPSPNEESQNDQVDDLLTEFAKATNSLKSMINTVQSSNIEAITDKQRKRFNHHINIQRVVIKDLDKMINSKAV